MMLLQWPHSARFFATIRPRRAKKMKELVSGLHGWASPACNECQDIDKRRSDRDFIPLALA